MVQAWVQPGRNPPPPSEVNFHVTMVRPKSVLPDGPLFTLEQGAERAHHFEAPHGARRLGVDGYVVAGSRYGPT